MLSSRVLLGAMLIIAITCAFFLTGCQPQDKPASPPEKAKTSVAPSEKKGKEITFSGKDGDVIREESGKGVIPEDFPEDVPLPQNGTVRLSQHRVKTDTFAVIIDTDESPEDVVGYYESEAARKGWKVTRKTDFGPLVTLEAVKEARLLQVQVSKEAKSTQVYLTLTPGNTTP